MTVCGLCSVYTVVTRCCNEMGAKTAVRVLLCSKITFFFLYTVADIKAIAAI